MKPDVATAERHNLDNDRDNSLSTIEEQVLSDYKYGFVTEIEADEAPKGLSEDIVRFISTKKNEPEWMLEWRLKAFRHWTRIASDEPTWANIDYPPINYQDIIYYSAPKQKVNPKNLDEVDPELRRTFERLGISLDEQKRLSGVAVDAVIDSISIGTTFKANWQSWELFSVLLVKLYRNILTWLKNT
jgi:ABC-type transport system involved in Fe-S cluster assembly, permease component